MIVRILFLFLFSTPLWAQTEIGFAYSEAYFSEDPLDDSKGFEIYIGYRIPIGDSLLYVQPGIHQNLFIDQLQKGTQPALGYVGSLSTALGYILIDRPNFGIELLAGPAVAYSAFLRQDQIARRDEQAELVHAIAYGGLVFRTRFATIPLRIPIRYQRSINQDLQYASIGVGLLF